MTEDHPFQQGVAGEAVGAVESGGCDFTAGEEAVEIGPGIEVGGDSPDGVMGGGSNRDELACRIEAVIVKVLGHLRKSGYEAGRIDVTNIQEYVGRRRASKSVMDGTADHVARRQFRALVVIGHETTSIGVTQECAFSTKGLAHQKRPATRIVKHGRMELYKLHVSKHSACAQSHGQSIASGPRWIGVIPIHGGGAAGGQYDNAGFYDDESTM